MIERFLRAEEISVDQSWALLRWCAARGASEFTLSMLGLKGYTMPFCDHVAGALAPFRLDDANREHPTAPTRDQIVRRTELWRLSDDTIALFITFFAEGLFTYTAGEWETGCLEDPVIYRDGEMVLGVVSHEQEAVLRLTAAEHQEIATLGIATRDTAQWI